MGLRVDVLRRAGRQNDCSNNGVTARFTTLTLTNVDGPFEPNDNAPAAQLERSRGGHLRIVPDEVRGRMSMMGGNYVTGDDRLSEAASRLLGSAQFFYPIPVHDRVEG